MNNLVQFVFESHPVRVLADANGKPLFVAKDVAEALGYKDPATAIKSHCKGVQELHPLQTAGGTQEVRVIREPDMYRLVFGSTLPSAEAFECLVVEEVLPAIRETGQYLATPHTYIDALKALVIAEEAKEAALAQARALNHQVLQDQPFTELGRAISSTEVMTRRDWLGLMKDESGLNVTERALTNFLKQRGYCYRDQLSGDLRAYAQYGHLFKLVPKEINGFPRVLLMVTGEGIMTLTPLVLANFADDCSERDY